MGDSSSLYTGKDAVDNPGIDSSIEKWQRILAALRAVGDSAGTRCGLCAMYTCTECPLTEMGQRCVSSILEPTKGHTSKYSRFSASLNATIFKAKLMLKMLESCEEKKEKGHGL